MTTDRERIRNERIVAEATIMRAIAEFERATGLHVRGVGVVTVSDTTDGETVAAVELEVRAP